MPETMVITCSSKTEHDPAAPVPLQMIQFRIDGGRGTLHLYRTEEAADLFKIGKKYELTLSTKE